MSIIENKKAFHDYFIEERYEAGIVLEGWEVKAIRAGRVQLKEAYVVVKQEEVWLVGCHISALPTASTHVKPDPARTRKLLLHGAEIRKLIGKVQQAGFTLVPGEHPIIPVMLGDAALAQQMAAKLYDLGVYVTGFFYPVVPQGKARIRTQMSAAHTAEDITAAVAAFTAAGKETGVI